jgi:hypothetical protein
MWDFPWDFLNGDRRVEVHVEGPTQARTLKRFNLPIPKVNHN